MSDTEYSEIESTKGQKKVVEKKQSKVVHKSIIEKEEGFDYEFYSVNQLMTEFDEIKYTYACIYFRKTIPSQYGRSAPIERIILLDKNMKMIKDMKDKYCDDFINISGRIVKRHDNLFNKQDSSRNYLKMVIDKELKGNTDSMIYHETEIMDVEDYEKKHLGLIQKQFKIVF